MIFRKMIKAGLRSLYRDILREASAFKDTNFRKYFVRITRDDFRQFRRDGMVNEPQFLETQRAKLDVLKRQSVIQNMYHSHEFAVKR